MADRDRVTEGLLLVFGLGLAFSITFSQVLLALVVARWLWKLREPAVRQGTRLPLALPFLALSAVTLLGAVLSDSPWQALHRSDSLLLILVFFAAVNLVDGRAQIERLLLALTAAITLSAIYGLLQTAVCTGAGPVPAWAAWLLRVKPSACGATFPFRAKGFYSIYMTLGGVGLMALIMAAALSFSAVGRRRLLLSLSGIGLETDQELPAEGSLNARLSLPGREPIISKAQLIWQRGERHAAKFQSGWALTGLSPSVNELIAQILAEASSSSSSSAPHRDASVLTCPNH